jgi:SAM-dependent methyltransferase
VTEAISQVAANAYDAVPYKDFPYSFTHPRHLEAMGTLFGMSPPDITRCRVLELGCAGGGNIIPQAADLPESTFLGIDISPRQIEQGSEVVEKLGLENIELRAADILAIDDSWGRFDYIIAHGVFSWVPYPVQEKILEVCSRNLGPQGVCIVSYNCYPGWHLANVVRDVMRFHAEQFDEPLKKIEQAKAILEFLVKLAANKGAAAAVLKEELDKLNVVNNDTYVFHEHLEDNNLPVYFYQFIERAEARGLQYLGETDFCDMLLKNLPPDAHEPFGRLPLIRQEQYMDFARGRRFRKTMLCHRAVRLNRKIPSEAATRFHFRLSGPLEVEGVDIRDDATARFGVGGNHLTVANRVTKAAMIYLKDVYPAYASFRDLHLTALARVAASRPEWAGRPEADPLVLAGHLLQGFGANLFSIAVHPPRLAGAVPERPQLSPLARIQAQNGGRLTSQLHQPITVDPFARWLAHRLDGSHRLADLRGAVRAAVDAGEVTIHHKDDPKAAATDATIGTLVDQALASLCRSGLLVG